MEDKKAPAEDIMPKYEFIIQEIKGLREEMKEFR